VETVRMCRRYDVPAVVGAFTPTEILTAWEAGASMVKLFPARSIGPAYIKDVHGPLPHIPIVPTGGVSLGNCAEFITAGAAGIAVGSHLVDRKLVEEQNWSELTQRAAAFVTAVTDARGSLG